MTLWLLYVWLQVLFRNLIFGTPALPFPLSSLLVESYPFHGEVTRGVRKTKALFRSACCPVIKQVNAHKFPMTCGETVPVNPAVGIMNHYWGMRATGFNPLSPENWAVCREDYNIQVTCMVNSTDSAAVKDALLAAVAWQPATCVLDASLMTRCRFSGKAVAASQ